MSWKRPLPTRIGHCGGALWTQPADFSAGTTSLLPTRSTPRCDLWSSESKDPPPPFSTQFAESIASGDNKGRRDKVLLYQCAGAHSKFALNAG